MQNPSVEQCRHESSTVEELILANAVTSTDQQLVCTMAMVCKDWKMAVQHLAPAGLLHVKLQLCEWRPSADMLISVGMKKLGSLSEWLPKHARLVSKLEVKGQLQLTDADRALFIALAAPLFSRALRSAALATAAQAAAKAAAAAAAQLGPLGMQSYSSNIFHDSAVLQALPAASLTHLQLTGSIDVALAAALPRLSNLQHVHLDMAGGGLDTISHSSVCAAAGQVSTLTSLKLGWVRAADVTQLPVQLARLELHLLDKGPVYFSHLTGLSSLNISASTNSPSHGQVLPAGLAELIIGVSSDPSVFRQSNISQLQSLKSLAIWMSRQSPEDLRQLGALPALQKLSLGYYDDVEAAAASTVWASLWQLKDIQLYFTCASMNFVELLDKLSSVTQLTRLAMFIYLDLDHGDDQDGTLYGVGRQISRLHQLRDLAIRVSDKSKGQLTWAQGDVNHLSTLTQLTKLYLSIVGFAREVVDDLNVTSLLREMKQLQILQLRVPVKGLAVFPVIGDLSNLRTLELYNVPANVQQTVLRELQCLKRLTELQGFDSCSKQALADFWNAVRS